MKRMLSLPWIMIIAVSLFTVSAGSAQTTADPLVLTNGFLIDGTGGKPVNGAVLVIENGRVALGTDFSGYIFDFESGMPMTEIFLMKEAGMTPMEIIVSATKHAALVCNLGDQIGTLEPGKIADILVVNNNPLDDLNALKDVRMVIRNGEIIRWES